MTELAEKLKYQGVAEANRNRVWSKESRNKISKSLLGNTRGKCPKPKVAEANRMRVWKESSKIKSRISHKPGIPRTTKDREKISKGVKRSVVEGRHPNYKGGITPKNKAIRGSIEYRLWREAVFARDNWTCQSCKERGGTLHAHHIQPFALFPELRFAIDNGETLCVSCHISYHEKTNSYKQKQP